MSRRTHSSPDVLDTEIDREILVSLRALATAATPAQRVTLLALAENPQALDAVEKLWGAIVKSRS